MGTEKKQNQQQRNDGDRPVVVITGSSGLIGSRLTENLTDAYTVVGLDVVEPDDQPEHASFVECDLTDDDSVRSALQTIRKKHGDRIASVVHLAAYYDFTGEPSEMYQELTVDGTRRLIESLQDELERVEQFVFSSSLLAMKPLDSEDGALTEASPTRGEWAYPQSKLEAERALKEHHGDIPVVIHRIAGVYDEKGHSLPITQHIRRIYEREMESYLFPGDPDHGQAFVHLDDLITCLRQTIDRRDQLENWELFLIGEPDVMSHEELQDRIGGLIHGREWPTVRVPKAVAKAGAWAKKKILGEDQFIKPWMIDMADDHYPVAIERAKRKLDWTPEHRLRDTLPTMIERLKDHPVDWYETNNLDVPDGLREHISQSS